MWHFENSERNDIVKLVLSCKCSLSWLLIVYRVCVAAVQPLSHNVWLYWSWSPLMNFFLQWHLRLPTFA